MKLNFVVYEIIEASYHDSDEIEVTLRFKKPDPKNFKLTSEIRKAFKSILKKEISIESN